MLCGGVNTNCRERLGDDYNNVAGDENVCHTGGDADAGVGDRVDACGRGSAILANIEILRW